MSVRHLLLIVVPFPCASPRGAKEVPGEQSRIPPYIRGWSLCEIMDQAGAELHKSGQQQRLLFPEEAGQDDYIKEICSPKGLVFNPARLQLDLSALLLHFNQKERSSLI